MTDAPLTSLRGVRLIEKWEGLYLHAYQDSVGIWTIGWGSITNPQFNISVHRGDVIDKATAEKWLQVELREKEAAVASLVKVPLSQYQYDTLVSFTYNVGIGALKKSTLLKLLNRGNYEAIPAQLMRYSYAGGRQIAGLANRRRDEGKMWRNEHIDDVPDTAIVRVAKEHIQAKILPDAGTVTLNSNTGRAASTQIMAGLATATAYISNPYVVGASLVVVGIGGFIAWRKFKDTQEMR